MHEFHLEYLFLEVLKKPSKNSDKSETFLFSENKLAKPKVINPCRKKGSYCGNRGAGRAYKPSGRATVKISSCECACPWLDFHSKDEKYLTPSSNFYLNKKSSAHGSDFKRHPSQDALPAGELIAIPCAKTFLHADSEGTKAFRNLKRRQNGQTKFTGCYSVDEGLLNENAINYDIREGTGSHFDVKEALAVQDYREEVQDGHWTQIMGKLGDQDELIDLNNLGVLTAIEQDLSAQRAMNEASGLQDRAGEMNANNNSRENVTDEHLKKFHRAFKKMTKLQRQAVRAVYLKNFENKTKVQVAKDLCISIDSLKERLERAFLKVKEEFTGTFKTKIASGGDVIILGPPLLTSKIPQVIKRTLNGVTEWIEPTPGNRPFGAIRRREGIDVDYIKRKIRA